MESYRSDCKKGDKNKANNYRPVSLTCILCKKLENLITTQLQNYMEENKFYCSAQHGFRKHRSCVTQLIEVMNTFTDLLDNNKDIDVLYLDFSKAFDTVPHKRLIQKLNSYGITGNLSKWIESFLSNRTQRVRVNSTYSNYTKVRSGIPQGSILGPLLFVIFINDLPEGLSSHCKIFADDTKLYGSPEDHDSIQEDLLKLMSWSDLWQLKFNIEKCSVLHMGKNNPMKNYYMDINSKTTLSKISNEKDIGVTFDKNLYFNSHINNIITKANRMNGIIQRSFSFLNKSTFLKLYKALIRPVLEYANVIWHPLYKGQLQQIENVQRRATKMVPSLKNKTYQQRLIELPSIKFRQLRSDLIQTYKIIYNKDIHFNEFFTFDSLKKTRNNKMRL